MSADSQSQRAEVPGSFLDLHRSAPGSARLRTPAAEVADRHDFCEDLAQLLIDTARDRHAMLHVTEADVLERIERGLHGPQAPVDAGEAAWVVRRLAELLGWPPPAGPWPPPMAVPGAARDVSAAD
jgi:hypothetical protein